jgi:murein DD-endopeptidase MepM/ murein hydrolase activator NlpD
MAINFVGVTWKVIRYNSLRDAEIQLRSRCEELQHRVRQGVDTVATLEAFPREAFPGELTSSFGLTTRNTPNLWPVNGILTSGFGVRMDPISGEGAYHAGVDLSVPTGTPVRAAANGIVLSAGWGTGYGKLIVVGHGGGIETYYAHLAEIQVIVGQQLHRGQIIATVGASGHTTGPHLHYEIRLGGHPVNPYPYLEKSARTIFMAQADFPF